VVPPPPPAHGSLRVDPALPRAWLGNEAIELTQREWSLLVLLVRHSGQVVSREDVLAVWQSAPGEPGGMASNALEVYVHRLRRKLAGSTLNIRNIRGLGYLLESAGTP
jgi:DNA-binding response OmpR family regulator